MHIQITDDFYTDLKKGEVLKVNKYDQEYGVYNCFKMGFTNNTAIVGERHCMEILDLENDYKEVSHE